MKRIISLLLCFSIVFGMVAYASPQDKRLENLGLRPIESELNAEGRVIKEISVCESSGTVYYFEITEDSIISMDMVDNGEINVYMRDIQNETELESKQTLPSFYIGSFKTTAKQKVDDKLEHLTNLSTSIQNNDILLKEVSANELGISRVVNTSKNWINDMILDALEDELGAETSSTFQYGEDYRNEYGSLYYSTSYSATTRYTWPFYLGASITAITTAMGYSQSALLAAFGPSIGLVSGVLCVILSVVNVDEHQGLVDHLKEVIVNGQTSHTSTKTEYYYVVQYVYEDDITPFNPTVGESKSSDYDSSNSYLVRKGIDAYLANQN